MATLPISAKIIIGGGTIVGVDNFPLNSAPYFAYLTPLPNLSGQVPTVTEHDSDDGPPEAINLEEQNRVWEFKLRVTGATQQAVAASISTLKRHIQGKKSTAYQAYRNGSQPDVTFQMQLNPSAPTTDFIIQYGSIPDNTSYYTVGAQNNDMALDVDVKLVCTPAGRGETINLRNDLPSSPHMIEDSNGDGLADGLVLNNFPAVDIVSTAALVGGVTQRFITAATGSEGLKTNVVTATAGDDVVAYADMRVDSGGDTVSVVLVDGGGNSIDDVKLDPSDPTATASKVFTSSDGFSMYRIVVSGTLIANDCELRIIRGGAVATTTTVCYIDKLYLQIDTSIVPDAWCSSSSLKNRYDPSAGNEDRINYLDVWGVPGDMPSRTIQQWATSFDPDASQLTIGKLTEGLLLPNNHKHFIDSSEFALGTGWSTTVDGTVIGGSYISTSAPATAKSRYAFSANESSWLNTIPVRAYAICYATDASITATLEFSPVDPSKVTVTSSAFAPRALNTWSFVDVGLLNITGAGVTNQQIRIDVFGSAGTFRLDGVFLFPTDEFAITPSQAPFLFSGINPKIDGDEKTLTLAGGGYAYQPPIRGAMWETIPKKMTRYVLFMHGDDATGNPEEFDLTNTMDGDFDIIPIASHLIGE